MGQSPALSQALESSIAAAASAAFTTQHQFAASQIQQTPSPSRHSRQAAPRLVKPSVARMARSRDFLLLTDIADRHGCHRYPQGVIQGKHSVTLMPMLSRRRNECCQPIQKIKRAQDTQPSCFGTEIPCCQTGTGGMTWPARCAAV